MARAKSDTDKKSVESRLHDNDMTVCAPDGDRERQRQLLESIYFGTSTAMFVVQVTEEGDFRFAGLNPAHTRVSGLTEEEVVGKTPEELTPLITPDIVAELRANYQRCLSEGGVIEYEEYLPLQGRVTWWLTRLNSLRDHSGRIFRIIGCSTDITRQKERELAEHREQLQKRTAAEVRKLLRAVEESPAFVIITDSAVDSVDPIADVFDALTS